MVKIKTPQSIDDWIKRYLEEEAPKSKSLIVTVFGDSIAPRSAGIWLSDLIKLMAPFDVNERLVRTNAFRLVEEDWLAARRDGRRSHYALTASGARRLELAYERVYSKPQGEWDDLWTIVFLPRTGEAALDRIQLKRELEWEGFASPAPGVMIHPAAQMGGLRQIVGDLGMLDRVAILQARSVEGLPGAPVDTLLQCWDLSDVRDRYRSFNARFEPLVSLIDRTDITIEQAFTAQTLMIHSFRRAILHDPRLPIPMLPADWPGQSAYELCKTIYERTHGLALKHVQSALSTLSVDETGRNSVMPERERFGVLR